MPSPIAHASAGYLVYRLYRPCSSKLKRFLFIATTITFSLLPDGDILPGLLSRNFGRYHRGFTHSLFSGFALSLGISSTTAKFRDNFFVRSFSIIFISYELHLLMDYLAGSKRGMMLFWPFSAKRFKFPLKLFYGVKWDQGFFSRKHIQTVVSELAFVALVFLLTRLVKQVLFSKSKKLS